mmetsp:Transcript_7327/g.23097  ORF Transcript_7327/g.23097 Transcript_7327/m.23097 type:complete len:112 (+) Transcript_7327:162-497(+)
MRTLWVSAALLATATAFQSPSQHAGLTSRTAFRPPTELNGLFGPSKAEQEAEAARIDREQEELNAKWAKESENELVFMSVFGVATSLPVIYLIYLAFVVDPDAGAGGAGIF